MFRDGLLVSPPNSGTRAGPGEKIDFEAATALCLGNDAAGAALSFDGRLYYLSLYDVALPNGEISARSAQLDDSHDPIQ